ncbi:arginyltransferase [Marinibactrum halimedae]|uniref:arginyltransferase n=1 Tax=Marinibactrum halimedae TaxID=1444977 RepID=UPI0039F67222
MANLRLFATHPHDCSYLPDRIATTVFVDPQAHIDQDVYSRLSEIGFRRSGQHLYKPQCKACRQCIPARIPVHQFQPNRQQRRCLKRNADLTVDTVDSIDSEEYFELYEKYINARHQDGDMYPPSRKQYDSFLTSEWGVTRFITFRLNDKLVSVAVIDVLDNGLSAVYTFYDPDYPKRSFGTFAILCQIEQAKALDLDSVYLGYWIRECIKMNYKTRFQPLELYIEGTWAPEDPQ